MVADCASVAGGGHFAAAQEPVTPRRAAAAEALLARLRIEESGSRQPVLASRPWLLRLIAQPLFLPCHRLARRLDWPDFWPRRACCAAGGWLALVNGRYRQHSHGAAWPGGLRGLVRLDAARSRASTGAWSARMLAAGPFVFRSPDGERFDVWFAAWAIYDPLDSRERACVVDNAGRRWFFGATAVDHQVIEAWQ